MVEKKDRHAKNKSMLTGRHDGDFFLDGEPRGGGGHRVETESLTLYEAVYANSEEVCDVYGLNENGTRTPYDELHAQVRPVPITRQTIYDQRGIPIKVEIQRRE